VFCTLSGFYGKFRERYRERSRRETNNKNTGGEAKVKILRVFRFSENIFDENSLKSAMKTTSLQVRSGGAPLEQFGVQHHLFVCIYRAWMFKHFKEQIRCFDTDLRGGLGDRT